MQFENLPQLENKKIEKRNPDFLKILGEIDYFLEKPEEEQRNYIDKRVVFLSKNAESGEISHVGRDVYSGFIGQKMEIRRNIMVDPLVVDDSDLYRDLFEVIKKFKSTDGYKEKSLREIILIAIQWTLSKYFGNIVANSNTDIQNKKFYLDHSSAESPSVSIKELKGKEFAVCAEKAAAAQNLLAFIGMKSDIIASSRCRIPAEADEEGHYYILVHGPKSDMIYDPTNPRLLFDKEEKLISYGPAMYQITAEQVQHLLNGESVVVEHVDDKIEKDGQRISKKQSRIYAGPKLK